MIPRLITEEEEGFVAFGEKQNPPPSIADARASVDRNQLRVLPYVGIIVYRQITYEDTLKTMFATKQKKEWWKDMAIDHKIRIAIALGIMLAGIIYLIAILLPSLPNVILALIIIWGGFSLLMTAGYLAEKYR